MNLCVCRGRRKSYAGTGTVRYAVASSAFGSNFLFSNVAPIKLLALVPVLPGFLLENPGFPGIVRQCPLFPAKMPVRS